MGNFERVDHKNQSHNTLTWEDIFSGEYNESEVKGKLVIASKNFMEYVKLLLSGMSKHLDTMSGQEFVTKFGLNFIDALEDNVSKATIAVILESGCNVHTLSGAYENLSDSEIQTVRRFFRLRNIETNTKGRSVDSILTRMRTLQRMKKLGVHVVK